MRQSPHAKRPRGRGSQSSNNGGRNRNVPLRHQTFDSNGPDVRVRGNAYQVCEKYLALGRDAGASGDRVAAENYYQHAEHYFRIINMNTDGGAANAFVPQSETVVSENLDVQESELVTTALDEVGGPHASFVTPGNKAEGIEEHGESSKML